MQLNFLQEDLLAVIRQKKSDDVSVILKKPNSANKSKQASVQASLLEDLPELAEDNKPPEKLPEAFKTISEASAIIGVPAHVLRFWESQFPQIKPTKSRGGRRYYRPCDMEILTAIKSLLYEQGYTIKGALQALKEPAKEIAKEAKVINVINDANLTSSINADKRNKLLEIHKEITTMRKQIENYLA